MSYFKKENSGDRQGTHRAAFNAAKNKLLKSGFLTHYDLSRPVKLKCDASIPIWNRSPFESRV